MNLFRILTFGTACAGYMWSQSQLGTGSISGVVLDPSGRAVSGTLYGNGGIAAVVAELGKIRGKFTSTNGASAAANSESSKREFHATERAIGTPVSAR